MRIELHLGSADQLHGVHDRQVRAKLRLDDIGKKFSLVHDVLLSGEHIAKPRAFRRGAHGGQRSLVILRREQYQVPVGGEGAQLDADAVLGDVPGCPNPGVKGVVAVLFGNEHLVVRLVALGHSTSPLLVLSNQSTAMNLY